MFRNYYKIIDSEIRSIIQKEKIGIAITLKSIDHGRICSIYYFLS